MRRPQRRLAIDQKMGAGSGRGFLVFRRTRPCRLRTPIRSGTVFTPGPDQPGSGTIVRDRETRRLPESSHRPELTIHVKCNIHSWMQACISVVDDPYFAVSGEDGGYRIGNLPRHLHRRDMARKTGKAGAQVTVAPHSNSQADATFKGTN